MIPTQNAPSAGPVKVIQVGLGGWGRDWYRRRIQGFRDVAVVGFVDSNEAALEAARDEFGMDAGVCHDDVVSALEATESDAVLITASLPGHVPAAAAALAAGRHVLMEKPFAPSVAEARTLVGAAARAGRILMISQNYRFFPAPIAARQIVTSGRLGKLGVVHVDFRKNNTAYDESRTRHYALPHPLLADMAIHHFDLMRMVVNADARRIRCHSFNPPWSHFSDHAAAEAVVEMHDGVVVTYRGSWVSQTPATPWSGEWRLEFERGELRFSSRDDETGKADRLWIREAGGRERPVRLAGMEAVDRTGSLVEFVHAVRTGEAPSTSGEANVGSIALTYAAIKAAAEGRWVDVER